MCYQRRSLSFFEKGKGGKEPKGKKVANLFGAFFINKQYFATISSITTISTISSSTRNKTFKTIYLFRSFIVAYGAIWTLISSYRRSSLSMNFSNDAIRTLKYRPLEVCDFAFGEEASATNDFFCLFEDFETSHALTDSILPFLTETY